ncbi:class I SAM-dependent methyltransferase [Ensifer sp. LC163]|uniref:class I SAM-dependent methyltransferase n=1 Tax=Ensifer sp. LC163 TaxID=1120652 RepID=UPI0008132322|nr:class I SAM-dependent methyltransferase [Ensifer sp. LC163]OCP35056.1 SAM-dependent methyltransferase [Ensifer sp. LC163]
MLSWLKKRRRANAASVESIFDQYELRRPAAQNAIDALPGWNSAFPEEFGLHAGRHYLYADDRIAWAIEQYGAIENCRILEVGPLEGMHTYMLNGHRPARIDAIEANRLCFLRCLVAGHILNIDRANFMLGDIQEWLRDTDISYDLAIASGVLYHMSDPGEFLQLLSKCSNTLFLWTHFFHDEAMPPTDVRRRPFSGRVEIRNVGGKEVRYHERSYQDANSNASFCGGMKDRHFWMQRDDILELLGSLGYSSIEIHREELDHAGGPCFSLFARK